MQEEEEKKEEDQDLYFFFKVFYTALILIGLDRTPRSNVRTSIIELQLRRQRMAEADHAGLLPAEVRWIAASIGT